MQLKLGDPKILHLRILKREGLKTVTRAQLEANNMAYFRELFESPNHPHHPIPITFPRVVSREISEWLTQLMEEEVRD